MDALESSAEVLETDDTIFASILLASDVSTQPSVQFLSMGGDIVFCGGVFRNLVDSTMGYAETRKVTRESTIERKHRTIARAAGWFVEKIMATGMNGFPDRPPAFREAHAAYLARRVATAERHPEATESDFARDRPCVHLAAILDAVDRFRAETHPLALLRIASDDGAAMAEARAARDRLVAWFAERGVDVET